MSLFGRFITSFREKGPRTTAGLVSRRLSMMLSKIGDRGFDLRYGTDTLNLIELENLDIESPSKPNGMRYEPTRARPMRRLLQAMAFPKDSVFVDFGCGKGRVLLVASDYGFKQVVGVEFSPQLCEQARRNLAIYRRKTGIHSEVEIVESDVLDYEIRSDETTFFFFNPFDAEVMGKVLSNIVASHKKYPRRMWLIYHNPEFREVLDCEDFFVKLGSYTFGGGEFAVYTNRG